MLPTALTQAATDPTLKPRDLKALVILCDELSTEPKPLKHSWLAKKATIHRQDAGAALRRLTRRGYLAEGPRSGRLKTYRLVAA